MLSRHGAPPLLRSLSLLAPFLSKNTCIYGFARVRRIFREMSLLRYDDQRRFLNSQKPAAGLTVDGGRPYGLSRPRMMAARLHEDDWLLAYKCLLPHRVSAVPGTVALT